MQYASDPTFDFLLAGIRPPADPSRRDVIAACARATIDWGRFLALANRHRVGPLVAESLLDAQIALPPPLAAHFSDAAKRALFVEMALASEVDRVVTLLSGNGIEPILLKGPGLSLRAFGRLGMRTYRDLDLLVDERDISTVEALLVEADYERIEPSLDAGNLAAWARHHKDAVFRHVRTGVLLELHWRLFDNRCLMPLVPSAAGVTLGIAPLGNVLVLLAELEFRYLCLHGALHAWSRLRWLADVNATLARVSPEFLLAAARSPSGRIGPAAAQALILCRDLLGAVLPSEMTVPLARSRRGNWLARLATRELLRSDAQELEATRLGSTVKNLSHYLMLEGIGALVEELRFDFAATPRAR